MSMCFFNLPLINVGAKEGNSLPNFFFLGWSWTFKRALANISRLRNTTVTTLADEDNNW